MSEVGNPSPWPSVLGLLESRSRGMHDPFRLALAVEGGGMRGVVTAGMLAQIQESGIWDLFDGYLATSSGSINLAFAAIKDIDACIDMYVSHGIEGARRIPTLRNPSIVDMNAVRRMIVRRAPNIARQLEAVEKPIEIVVTDTSVVRPMVVDVRHTGDSTVDFLLASAWLPIAAGTGISIEGTKYLDGGLLCPHPLIAARHRSYTHVLFMESAERLARRESSRIGRVAMKSILNRWAPTMGDNYLNSRSDWSSERPPIGIGESAHRDGIQLMRVAPAFNDHRVSRFCRKSAFLTEGVRVGYSAAKEQLSIGTIIHKFDQRGGRP